MKSCSFLLLAALIATPAVYGTTIQFNSVQVGTDASQNPIDRLTYSVTGLTLDTNEFLDIQFNPAMYGTLSNPMVSNQLTATVLEPNAGFTGDFLLSAVSNGTVVTGPFSIDVDFLGSGTPGPQSYFVYTVDASGQVLDLIASGNTIPVNQTVAPEPKSVGLGALALALIGVWRVARRKSCSARLM